MVRGQSKCDKLITSSKLFAGKVEEDPILFLKNLVVDTEANRWDETDLLEVIRGFLKDDVKKWFIDNRHQFQYWDKVIDSRHSFVLRFVVRFKTKTQVEI